MTDGETRITLRVSDVEMEEINDFLARHPEFQNRSQLIRQAVMEYIKYADRGGFKQREKETEIYIQRESTVVRYLSEMVKAGYFTTVDEAVMYILWSVINDGTIVSILQRYANTIESLENILEQRKRRMEYPGRDSRFK